MRRFYKLTTRFSETNEKWSLVLVEDKETVYHICLSELSLSPALRGTFLLQDEAQVQGFPLDWLSLELTRRGTLRKHSLGAKLTSEPQQHSPQKEKERGSGAHLVGKCRVVNITIVIFFILKRQVN